MVNIRKTFMAYRKSPFTPLCNSFKIKACHLLYRYGLDVLLEHRVKRCVVDTLPGKDR